MDRIWSAEVWWQVFQATGSIWAYLAYRRCAGGNLVPTWASLN